MSETHSFRILVEKLSISSTFEGTCFPIHSNQMDGAVAINSRQVNSSKFTPNTTPSCCGDNMILHCSMLLKYLSFIEFHSDCARIKLSLAFGISIASICL